MLNYIVLTPFFPSKESFRGSYILDQAKAIQSNSNYHLTVIILCSFFDKSYGDYEIEGVQCKTFKVIDFPSFILPGFFNALNVFRFKLFLKNQGVYPNKDSIIHGHITYPSLNFLEFFYRKFNSKTILQHHGLDVLQTQTGVNIPILKSVQNKYILSRFTRLSSTIYKHIAVSSIVAEQLVKINPKLKKSTYVCVNGVDTNKFYIDSTRKKDKNKFIVGCVANFWELKNQITLLKAVNILNEKGLHDIHIKFVGSGKTLNECKTYAKTHHLDCEFIHEIKHDQLSNFYNQLDLFVLPSYYEAFGCVYLEALACGVPYIGVKNQGIEDVIAEEFKSVQLIDRESSVELSKLISYFYSNNPQIKFDEKYSIDNTIKRLLNNISIKN